MPAGIAATRPIAVAISASEMPGATIAIVALCTAPIAWNERMMPTTVPNRPTYGLVLLTVARNARLCSSRSTSRSCDTRIARRAPSMSWSVERPDSCFFAIIFCTSCGDNRAMRIFPNDGTRWILMISEYETKVLGRSVGFAESSSHRFR